MIVHQGQTSGSVVALQSMVDDALAVEVSQSGEHLVGNIGEEGFGGDAAALEGAAVHILKGHLDVAGMVVHAVELDDMGVISGAENLDLMVDLATDSVLMFAEDDLEGVC